MFVILFGVHLWYVNLLTFPPFVQAMGHLTSVLWSVESRPLPQYPLAHSRQHIRSVRGKGASQSGSL